MFYRCKFLYFFVVFYLYVLTLCSTCFHYYKMVEKRAYIINCFDLYSKVYGVSWHYHFKRQKSIKIIVQIIAIYTIIYHNYMFFYLRLSWHIIVICVICNNSFKLSGLIIILISKYNSMFILFIINLFISE